MIARRSVWSDPQVVALANHFVPVADEVHHLQTAQDPEALLFQKIAEQGHYAGFGPPKHTGTRQGTYAAAPSGVLLASINSNDPRAMAAMLEKALARWSELSREERLLPDDPENRTSEVRRAERFYPEDGLALRVNSRDLPREGGTTDWRAGAWNIDYAWFTKAEARQFLPAEPVVGATEEVPAPIVRRIARAHLIDNVRGQTFPFRDDEVEKARLTSVVTGIEGDIVSLRLEGETRTSAEGVWPMNDRHDAQTPTLQRRGFETRLLGYARYDLGRERFVAFELVAAGDRWGATQYNRRHDDKDPAPMGVALTLAGDSPAERVAPAFFWIYGWK